MTTEPVLTCTQNRIFYAIVQFHLVLIIENETNTTSSGWPWNMQFNNNPVSCTLHSWPISLIFMFQYTSNSKTKMNKLNSTVFQ